MVYVIINWASYEDIELVRNRDGSVKVFRTLQTAKRYTKNLNFNYKVVKI